MKKIIAFIIAAALFVISLAGSAAAEPKITEQQVSALLKVIDQETAQQDNQAVLTHIADNVVVTLTVPGPKGPQTITLNKSEYQSNMEQGAQAISNYKYQRGNTKIEISRDGKSARVTDVVYESFTMEGKTVHTVSQETTVFTLIGGQLLATAIDAEVVDIK